MKKKILITLIIIAVVAVGFFAWQRTASAPDKPSQPNKNVTESNHTKPVEVPSFNKTQFSTTDPASPWVVVNKQHPLNPKDYAPTDLVDVGGRQLMRAEAAGSLSEMLAGAKAAGYVVTPASGYRSYQTQVSVYNNEVKAYGQAVADSESARPGYSEHQTGWAIDLASAGCSITDCFGDTPGGKWVAENAYRYGFLLRYTPSDTSQTGYRAESWHFRYIGKTLSEELHKENVATLEQFFGIAGGSSYN